MTDSNPDLKYSKADMQPQGGSFLHFSFYCITFKLNRDQLTAAFAMYLVFPKSTNIQESHFTGTAHFSTVQRILNSCSILVGDESMLHLGRSQ